MSFVVDIGFFALLFFVLVFIHELGHFLMARLVGVRVERFSIGMGQAIFSKKIGDTEYRIAWLPLGGYVKMSGSDTSEKLSPEEAKVGFLTQSPPKKLLIVFGGPVSNLILPFFIFGILLAVGIPSTETRVGSLEPNFPASNSGLRPGDLIMEANGKPARKFQDFEELVKASKGASLKLQVERESYSDGQVQKLEIDLQPIQAPGKSKFGEDIKVWKVGLSPFFKLPKIYFEDSTSPLAKAGAQVLDVVKKVNGRPVITLEQMTEALEAMASPLQLEVLRDGDIKVLSVDVPSGSGSAATRIGLLPVELVVGQVEEFVKGKDGKSIPGPAWEAGLRPGDRLISIGGVQLRSWEQVPELIKASKGEDLRMIWSRAGQVMDATFAPQKTIIRDPVLGKDSPLAAQDDFRIGIGPKLEVDSTYVIDQSWNPLHWISHGVRETWDLTSMTLQALTKLLTGQLSLRSLGSPIMIFNVAGNSYRMAGGGQHGWSAFLRTLALLSISLGLVNLFPIPVLDGGHATFFVIEWIRGRPLSSRFMDLASQVGMVLLLALFAFVIYNDINRYGLLDRLLNFVQ